MAVGSGNLGSLVPGAQPPEPVEDETVEDRERRADASDREPKMKTETKETRRGPDGR